MNNEINRRGQQFNLAALGALALILTTTILTVALGSRVVFQLDNTFVDGTVAENITRTGDGAIQQFAEFFPIIGLVIVAAIVLDLIRRFR